MRQHFFSKCSKFNVHSENAIKKKEKKFLVFQIIVFKLLAVNFPITTSILVVGSQRVKTF